MRRSASIVQCHGAKRFSDSRPHVVACADSTNKIHATFLFSLRHGHGSGHYAATWVGNGCFVRVVGFVCVRQHGVEHGSPVGGVAFALSKYSGFRQAFKRGQGFECFFTHVQSGARNHGGNGVNNVVLGFFNGLIVQLSMPRIV